MALHLITSLKNTNNSSYLDLLDEQNCTLLSNQEEDCYNLGHTVFIFSAII